MNKAVFVEVEGQVDEILQLGEAFLLHGFVELFFLRTVEVPVYESDKLPENAEVFLYDVPLSEYLQRYIYEICADKNVPVTLVMAMIDHESRFNAEVISSTEDYGLMQINSVNHDWLEAKHRCADNRKYNMISNPDGTVSFEDVTEYSQKENSFFGADEANAMNAGMNELAENMESVAENTKLAKTSAETATTKATAAANSAAAAVNSQSSAASSASTASSKASAAANSATQAAASAEEAKNSADVAATLLYTGAGAHNAIYRGKSLGSAVTEAQWAAIKAGTFEDMYIGDYWTIDGVTYRIAAFNYYYNTGDTACTKNHITLVPDNNMYTRRMNDTSVTTGAYVGSEMYTEGLAQAKTTINSAFGEAHVLNHRQYLQNAVTDGYASGGSWYDSTVELMTEQNVYGGKIYGNSQNGTASAENSTVDKSQYPLFAFRPDMISNKVQFWLRDVVSASRFAIVASTGRALDDNARSFNGVRPAFSIYQS